MPAYTFNISSITPEILDTFEPNIFQFYFMDVDVDGDGDVDVTVTGFSRNPNYPRQRILPILRHKHALLRPATVLCFVLMQLIAAAMEEELQLAMVLCQDREKKENQGVCYWQARRAEKEFIFFKTGIGPRRSASNLQRILNLLVPSHILLIGYAGALDPNLKLADLVAIRNALGCSLSGNDPALGNLQLDREFELTEADAIVESARSLGLRAFAGNALTSAHVLGIPEDKHFLYKKYGASIVDMETAAVARIAASKNIPLSCIRAVSDEAEDTFLAPFSYNPSANIAARAVKIIGAGIQSYQQWKMNSQTAGETLNRFLAQYL